MESSHTTEQEDSLLAVDEPSLPSIPLSLAELPDYEDEIFVDEEEPLKLPPTTPTKSEVIDDILMAEEDPSLPEPLTPSKCRPQPQPQSSPSQPTVDSPSIAELEALFVAESDVQRSPITNAFNPTPIPLMSISFPPHWVPNQILQPRLLAPPPSSSTNRFRSTPIRQIRTIRAPRFPNLPNSGRPTDRLRIFVSDGSSIPICFNCNNAGHVKKNCPNRVES
jgi:hypothetical protein